MANPRQRKKARSSIGRKTVHNKDKHRRIKLRTHPVLKKHWDHKLTLKQNYKRLGLAINLNGKYNIDEPVLETAEERRHRIEEASEPPARVADDEMDPEKIPLGEARLIRGEDGEVKEIIYGKMEIRQKPIEEKPSAVIDEMVEYEQNRPRSNNELFPSERENDWLFDLYSKYGDDYEAMKWDKKLNQMFFSAGQLKQKIKRWKKFNNIH